MMVSLDTCVIMRYIWNDIPEQAQRVRALLDDKEKTFFIPDLVVSEIIYNMQIANLRRSSIVGVLYELAERKNVEISSFIMDAVLPFFAEHPALSFVDCYAAFEAEKKRREPLLTFDKKLASQHPNAKEIK